MALTQYCESKQIDPVSILSYIDHYLEGLGQYSRDEKITRILECGINKDPLLITFLVDAAEQEKQNMTTAAPAIRRRRTAPAAQAEIPLVVTEKSKVATLLQSVATANPRFCRTMVLNYYAMVYENSITPSQEAQDALPGVMQGLYQDAIARAGVAVRRLRLNVSGVVDWCNKNLEGVTYQMRDEVIKGLRASGRLQSTKAG